MSKQSIILVLSLVAVLSPAACGRGITSLDDPSATLNCGDLLPPEQTSFDALYALVAEPGSSKGCAGCHNSVTPVYGYDFSTKAAAYDAFSTKAAIIYGQVAAGQMPKEVDVPEASEGERKVGESCSETDRCVEPWDCVQGTCVEGERKFGEVCTEAEHCIESLACVDGACTPPWAGTPWEVPDLQLLRSWWCHGGFFD
jgi:hypothetical protein